MKNEEEFINYAKSLNWDSAVFLENFKGSDVYYCIKNNNGYWGKTVFITETNGAIRVLDEEESHEFIQFYNELHPINNDDSVEEGSEINSLD